MPEVLFHPEARDEYQQAYEWYLTRSPRSAVRFEAELDRVLDEIAKSPDFFTAFDRDHRFAMLRKFPYSVVYRSTPDQILIVALAHSRRSVGYWGGRR